MSVCKPWLWPYAPSNRRPLDHIWTRPSWSCSGVWIQQGWGSGHRRPSPRALGDSPPAQHSWHQLVIHVCHLHHQGNMRVNETGVCWSTERMLDVFGWHVAPVQAWTLIMIRPLRALIFGRRRGHQSNLANRHFNPTSPCFVPEAVISRGWIHSWNHWW